MNKSFLISLTTAIALGYAAGFATNGLTSAATKPVSYSTVIHVPMTGAVQTAWQNFLRNYACDAVVTAFGIDAPQCTANLFKAQGTRISWDANANQWQLDAQVDITGTWTPGSPQ